MKLLDITKEKQDKSMALIKKTAEKAFSTDNNYIVVYGFLLKGLFLNSKTYNFLLGFNADKRELCLSQFTAEGNIIGENIILNQDHIVSIKTYKSGAIKITNTETDKPIKITVPAILPDIVEMYKQLPIYQKDEARLFYTFIKTLKESIKQDGK